MGVEVNPDNSDDKHQHKSTDINDLSLAALPPNRYKLAYDYFAGQVEEVIQQKIGIPSPQVENYLSDLLTRFISSDALFGVRDVRGTRLSALSDMQLEADARTGPAKFKLLRHLGDFALYHMGYSPEYLELAKKNGGKDSLIDFADFGRRSYYNASHFVRSIEDQTLLISLSFDFEKWAFALGEVRRTIENEANPNAGFLLGRVA